MNMLRTSVFGKGMLLFVGILFINLNFILSEVSALKKTEANKDLLKTIVRILTVNGLEEEVEHDAPPVEDGSSFDLFPHAVQSGLLYSFHYLAGHRVDMASGDVCSGIFEDEPRPPKS